MILLCMETSDTLHKDICAHTRTYTHTRTHAHTCARTRTHTHTHTHTEPHTHTHPKTDTYPPCRRMQKTSEPFPKIRELTEREAFIFTIGPLIRPRSGA